MNNIQRFALFAVLFLLGFMIINYASCKSNIEGYGRGGGRGRGGRGWGGRGGIGRGWGGRGGYYGGGYYGGYGYNPVYIYDDSNYGYSYPYWYRYIPFLNYYYY